MSTRRTTKPAPTHARVLILGLYSAEYPAIGESHGLSVIGGTLGPQLGDRLEALKVIDMVAYGEEDCTQLLPVIRELAPNVLAIGLQYGTYSVLRSQYASLQAELTPGSLVIFGGPIATYQGARLLDEIDPKAVVVEGEGDIAFPQIVEAWLEGRSMRGIPNCRFVSVDDGLQLRRSRATVSG